MQNYAQMYWSIRSKEVHRKIYPKYLIIVEQFEPVSQFYLILIRSFSRTAFRNMMKKIRKSEKIYLCRDDNNEIICKFSSVAHIYLRSNQIDLPFS